MTKKTEQLTKVVVKDTEISTQTITILKKDFKNQKAYEHKISDTIDDIYHKFMNNVGFKPSSVAQMQQWMYRHLKTLKGTKHDEDMTDAFDVYYIKTKSTHDQRIAKKFNPDWPIFKKFKLAFKIQADNRDNKNQMVLRYEIYLTK